MDELRDQKRFDKAIAWTVLGWLALSILAMLFADSANAQTAGAITPWVKQQFPDNSGVPVAFGKICTYAAGTTTPLATYSDSALGTPNTNPVLLDASGRPASGAIFLSATNYKFVLRDAGTDNTCSTGSILWTQDNIGDIGQILKANLALSSGSSLINFKQIGSHASTISLQTKLRQGVSATDYSGADIGAQINNALADQGNSGEVHVPAGTYNSVTTAVVYPVANSGNFRLIIDAGAVINYTGTGCAISAAATSAPNANNIQIYNFGQIIGTSSGKAGICLGAANRVVVWAGDISGFTNTTNHSTRGYGSAIYNEGANTVDFYGANLRNNRVGFYCTAANNASAGGWFPCNANHFYGGHIQANGDWGVVFDGLPGPLAGVNIKLQQNLLSGTVVEGNATATPATCSINGWVRSSGVVTVTCAAAHGLKSFDVVKNSGSLSGAGTTSADGTWQVQSVPTGTTFTYSDARANDSAGAGGTMTEQLGGVFSSNAAGLAIHSYFENNGTQQDILYGESMGFLDNAVISESTFASTNVANAIQVNASSVNIRDNYLGPNAGYTNFVRLSSRLLTGITLEANQMGDTSVVPIIAENGAIQELNYTMQVRYDDGSYRMFPKVRPMTNVASQVSPFIKLCGLNGASAENCGDIASYTDGTLLFQLLSRKALYFYGTVNATKTVYTPQVIAGAVGGAGTVINNLTVGLGGGGVIVFTVASTAAIGPVGASSPGVTAGVCVGNTSYSGSYTLNVSSATAYYINPTGSEATGCGATTPGTVTVGGAGGGTPSNFLSGVATGQAGNTDFAGQCTLGTNCVITFTNTYATAPICVATDTTAANATKVVTNTTTLTITGTGTDVINYVCVGRT